MNLTEDEMLAAEEAAKRLHWYWNMPPGEKATERSPYMVFTDCGYEYDDAKYERDCEAVAYAAVHGLALTVPL
jgi:hypothetical protein